ncbi:prefoldin subunit 6 [Pyronema omphalodes]|nr:prefoldin subunit 6 [Pyronema omphalodes]
MSDSQKLQALTQEFQNIQTELSTVVEARQKLESQLTENQSVQKEFSSLGDDAKIYKLVGPVLLKQEKSEAVMGVDRRLEFINSEINRVETQLAELNAKQEKKKIEIIGLQTKIQEAAAATE